MVERKLGRGFQFLLSEAGPSGSGDEVLQVPVERFLANRFQPRTEFPEQELNDLAQSIRATGVLQPIVARRQGDRFEVVAGERRLRAARLAGLERIPTIVRDVEEDKLLLLALVENLQRSDLNAIEKARALQQIQKQAGLTQDEVAQQVGLNRTTLANFLRLLDLPPTIQAYVSRGTLSMGHARAMLGLPDPELMEPLAQRCIRESLSVRQVESLVQELAASSTSRASGGEAPPKRGKKPVWLQDLEQTLTEALQTRVSIHYRKKAGRIVLDFYGRDEFDRLYSRLLGRDDEDTSSRSEQS
jgi:ParB family chromosome partitioning protein